MTAEAVATGTHQVDLGFECVDPGSSVSSTSQLLFQRGATVVELP